MYTVCVGLLVAYSCFTLPYEKVPSVTTGGTFHGMLRFMNKTYAPHVTSLLTGAGAVLAVIHPGFNIPAGVQGLIASICILASTCIQGLHYIRKSNLEGNIILATHLANQAAASVQQETAK